MKLLTKITLIAALVVSLLLVKTQPAFACTWVCVPNSQGGTNCGCSDNPHIYECGPNCSIKTDEITIAANNTNPDANAKTVVDSSGLIPAAVKQAVAQVIAATGGSSDPAQTSGNAVGASTYSFTTTVAAWNLQQSALTSNAAQAANSALGSNASTTVPTGFKNNTASNMINVWGLGFMTYDQFTKVNNDRLAKGYAPLVISQDGIAYTEAEAKSKGISYVSPETWVNVPPQYPNATTFSCYAGDEGCQTARAAVLADAWADVYESKCGVGSVNCATQAQKDAAVALANSQVNRAITVSDGSAYVLDLDPTNARLMANALDAAHVVNQQNAIVASKSEVIVTSLDGNANNIAGVVEVAKSITSSDTTCKIGGVTYGSGSCVGGVLVSTSVASLGDKSTTVTVPIGQYAVNAAANGIIVNGKTYSCYNSGANAGCCEVPPGYTAMVYSESTGGNTYGTVANGQAVTSGLACVSSSYVSNSCGKTQVDIFKTSDMVAGNNFAGRTGMYVGINFMNQCAPTQVAQTTINQPVQPPQSTPSGGTGGGSTVSTSPTATPTPSPTPLACGKPCTPGGPSCGGGMVCSPVGTSASPAPGASPTPGTGMGGYTCQNPACSPSQQDSQCACKPVSVAPICVDIFASKTNIKLGDQVSFTCGYVNGATKYEFRYAHTTRKTGLTGIVTTALATTTATSRTSVPITVDKVGRYIAQCRPCAGNNLCGEWEPLDGQIGGPELEPLASQQMGVGGASATASPSATPVASVAPLASATPVATILPTPTPSPAPTPVPTVSEQTATQQTVATGYGDGRDGVLAASTGKVDFDTIGKSFRVKQTAGTLHEFTRYAATDVLNATATKWKVGEIMIVTCLDKPELGYNAVVVQSLTESTVTFAPNTVYSYAGCNEINVQRVPQFVSVDLSGTARLENDKTGIIVMMVQGKVSVSGTAAITLSALTTAGTGYVGVAKYEGGYAGGPGIYPVALGNYTLDSFLPRGGSGGAGGAFTGPNGCWIANGAAGKAGGALAIFADEVVVGSTAKISVNGLAGGAPYSVDGSTCGYGGGTVVGGTYGGPGSGGSILIRSEKPVTLGTNAVTAAGGPAAYRGSAVVGPAGVIHIAAPSITGTTNPAFKKL